MSRHYSKSYGRKVGNVCATSIQFDKLFKENSNRPSAAKSAGTVGKWGITSFTSIRSTNVMGSGSGKREDKVVGAKRGRTDSQNSKVSSDSFSFDESDSSAPPIVKPKKFFKSRNAEPVPLGGEGKTVSNVYGSAMGDDHEHPIKPMRTAASRKMMTRTPSPPPAEPAKPPIVLRIFKGTSQLITTPSTPTSPETEFDLQMVEDPVVETSAAISTTNTKSKPVGTKKQRTRERRVVKDDSPEPEMIIRINTATSRAQRYSRRQAALETGNAPNAEEPHSEATANYNIYMSPQGVTNAEDSESPRSYASSGAALNSSLDTYEDHSSPPAANEVSTTDHSWSSNAYSVPKKEPADTKIFVAPLSELNHEAHQDEQAAGTGPDSLPVKVEQQSTDQTANTSWQPQQQQPWQSQAMETNNSDHVPYDETDQQEVKSEPEEPMQCEESPQHTAQHYTAQDDQQPAEVGRRKKQEEADQCERPEPFEHMSARDRFASRRNRSNNAEPGPNSAVTSVITNAVNSSSVITTNSDKSSFSADPIVSSSDGCGELSSNGMEAASATASSNPVPRKKGSIFKSRALQGSDENKKRALYKHKWSENQPNASAVDSNKQNIDPSKPSTSAYNIDDEFDSSELLTRILTWPTNNSDPVDDQEAITSVKCSKNSKGFYTVVRNVKKAHQIQESGEFQEFNDDVEYILDALQEQNPMGTRCLSAITLASKCMAPAFRMHVRAHGTVAKFFKALHDSSRDQSLGLCTATVMFALSQDRLNMDLDRDSLELMLNLLESDASHRNALEDVGLSSSQLLKNKQKVRELCAEIQSQGHAKHLNLDNITVGQLAMETLLSLTSRRAGEWFKEELRQLGGLEHIVRTICQCNDQIDDYVVTWTNPLLDRMRKIDRCLRVLENVTQKNDENQMYLLRYTNGALVDVLVRLLRLCGNEVPLYPVYDVADKESTGVVIREALLAVLKVLINLSHDGKGQTYGSTLVGSKDGLFESTLHMLLHIPNYIVQEKKFDLTVLALTLLINLVEHNTANRSKVINTKAPAEVENVFACNQKSAVEALIAMFFRQEEYARSEEAKTDAILDGKDTTEETAKDQQDKSKKPQQPANKSQDEFIEDTVAKLLAKAGRHMEHTFIAAYIGLLIGYIIMNEKAHEDVVRLCMPEHNFKVMVNVLQKFYKFMDLTVTATDDTRGLAATQTVINYMAKIDEPPKVEIKSEVDMPLDDLDGSMSS